jgi:predicted dehydrogenase
VRAAVVGAGFVGRIHARALGSHPDIEIVGVCGRTRPKTEALATELGTPYYLSVEEMLERAAPDIVCVATGNRDHHDPAVASLRAGAHVFLEKPMAFSLEEARAIVAAADQVGVALGVNFNHRFSAPYQRALAFLNEGSLGAVAYVLVKFAGDLYKDLNDPHCMLIETQGHSFDLMRLFGGEIEHVSAEVADPRAMGIYTSVAVTVKYISGAVGTLLGSWDSSYAHPGSQLLEVSGTEGRVVVDNVVDSVRLFHHDCDTYQEWRPGIFDAGSHDFWRTIDAHVHAFVDAVAEGRPPPVTGADGLRALELTFEAIDSSDSSTPRLRGI